MAVIPCHKIFTISTYLKNLEIILSKMSMKTTGKVKQKCFSRFYCKGNGCAKK